MTSGVVFDRKSSFTHFHVPRRMNQRSARMLKTTISPQNMYATINPGTKADIKAIGAEKRDILSKWNLLAK